MEYLIVASTIDTAGMNIINHMKDLGKFNFYLVDKEIIYTENLDLDKINKYDFIIFASKHKSEKNEKTLSVHPVGNWREAKYGGERKKVSPSSAIFLKNIFQELYKKSQESGLKDYDVTMECTHHGPLIDKPCIFIEIGSTETEYKDRKAGFVIAKTIRDVIQNFKENPYNEVAIAIGGPHYCQNFNKIQLKSNVAISHIIPSYALPVDEGMIKEAIEKTTEEEVDFAIIDWKSVGNSFARNQLLDVLNNLNVRYVKTSDIRK